MKGLTRSLVSLLALVAMLGAMLPLSLRTAQPVQAGNQTFAGTVVPAPGGIGVATAGNPGRIATANDGTIFAIVDFADVAGLDAVEPDGVLDDLAFSTNGGVTWTFVPSTGLDGVAAGIDALPWDGAAATQVAFSPNFSTDRTVFATSGTGLFRSVSGGVSSAAATAALWVVSGAGAAGAAITSVAVAPNFSTNGSVVVGFQGAALAATVQTTICTPACAAWVAVVGPAATGAGDVTDGTLAVSYSPNWLSDGVIVAVFRDDDADAICVAGADACESISTNAAAFQAAAATNPFGGLAGGGVAVLTPTSARIAFPTGFNITGANNYFVALSGSATSSVFRRQAGIWADAITASGGAATPATSIAVSGPYASAVVLAGVTAAAGGQAVITRSGDGGTTWNTAAINVGGTVGAVNVALSPNFATDNTVYAASNGVNGGFYASTTGGGSTLGWAARALYTDAYATMGGIAGDPADANPLFVVMSGGAAGSDALFRSTSGAVATATWAKVAYFAGAAAANNVVAVAVSRNFATDSTVYTSTATQLARSTNQGASFTALGINVIPSGAVTAGVGLAVADASTVYVLANNGSIHKTVDAGLTWTTTAVTGTPTFTDIALSPNYATDSTVLVAARTLAGAAQVWRSADAGATWALVGTHPDTATLAGRHSIAFDSGYATNNTIYSVTDTDVYRWVQGTSTAWLRLSAGANVAGGAPAVIPTGDADLVDLAVSNGVLYTPQSTAAAGIRRSLAPAVAWDGATANRWFDLEWAGMSGVNASPAAGTGVLDQGIPAGTTHAVNSVGMVVAPLTATSNLVLAINTATAPDTINTYTDQLLAAPVPLVPADGAQVAAAPTFQWTPYATLGTATYRIRVSTDPTFQNVVVTTYVANVGAGVFTVAAPAIPAFAAGTTYYWSIRAYDAAVENVQSPWSATRSYISGAGVTGLLYPISGVGQRLVVDSLTPGLSWSAVAAATDYEVQVTTNPSVVAAGGSYVTPTLTRRVGSATPALQLMDGDLSPSTVYYWQVRAIFGVATGAYSNLAFGAATTGGSGVFQTPAAVVASVDVAAATTSIAGAYDILWRFDNATQTWMSYTPGAPAFAQTLAAIVPAQPVWIYANRAAVWTRGSGSVTLVLGWNLVVAP